MKLVDKSVVLKEIERRAKFFLEQSKNRPGSDDISCSTALYGLLSFFENLETKEVDLKKEIQTWVEDNSVNGYYREDVYETAEHFFELGLKASD